MEIVSDFQLDWLGSECIWFPGFVMNLKSIQNIAWGRYSNYFSNLIPVNSTCAIGSIPVLIDFSRSPGLLSFSSGIFCCLSWNNIWFGRYFIHHTKRILLTYWVTRTIKSTWKTRSLENIQLSITASYSGIHFVDISIYSIYCTISNWPPNRPAVMQLFHINNLRFLLRF